VDKEDAERTRIKRNSPVCAKKGESGAKEGGGKAEGW